MLSVGREDGLALLLLRRQDVAVDPIERQKVAERVLMSEAILSVTGEHLLVRSFSRGRSSSKAVPPRAAMACGQRSVEEEQRSP